MRKFRAIPLVAFAAIVAVAFAAPAVASAAHWTQEGKALTEPATVSVNGTHIWRILGWGYECPIKGEATLSPGDKGEITKFEIVAKSCTGFGGGDIQSGCIAASTKSSAPLPIQAVVEGGKSVIRVSGFHYDINWTNCGNTEAWSLRSQKATLDWGLDNSSAMSTWNLGGQTLAGPGSWPTANYKYWVPLEGTLGVKPAGLYGIAN